MEVLSSHDHGARSLCLSSRNKFPRPRQLVRQQRLPPQQPKSQRAVGEQLKQLDQRVTAAQSAGDNAWMLVSAALVLMMTGPGLALFYGGLVRRKNTLAIMMQSFLLMALDQRALGAGGLQLVLWRKRSRHRRI